MIQKYYSNQIISTHEPIDHAYHGRDHLGHDSIKEFLSSASEPLKEHIGYIKTTLLTSDYIETGHTSWSVLQYFLEIFKGQMKIIWITRHPTSLVRSWITHGLYAKPILPHETEKIFILPSDKSVAYGSYQSKWDNMSQKEKILYYWLEVNTHAYRLLKNTKIENLVMKYEDLFNDMSMKKILRFTGLTYDDSLREDYTKTYDQYAYLYPYTDSSDFAWDDNLKDMAEKLEYHVDINNREN